MRIPSLGRRHLRPGPANNQAGDAGFSPERLGRIAKFFQAEVDKGALPGVTVLIARDGKIVYSQAVGFQDHEKKTPMKTDAIFRIASMSKPITSGAIMMLVEEGRIDLLAPVAQYLPEFKEGKVGTIKGEGANATLTTEDAHTYRVIELQDTESFAMRVQHRFRGAVVLEVGKRMNPPL